MRHGQIVAETQEHGFRQGFASFLSFNTWGKGGVSTKSKSMVLGSESNISMLSLQELTEKTKNRARELARKDTLRRACVKEFTQRLNVERARDNERKVDLYIWSKQVSRSEALKVLKKHPDKRERVWPPYTERAVHFKTVHVDPMDLRELLDRCNAAEKDGKSFGKIFSSSLKVCPTLSSIPS